MLQFGGFLHLHDKSERQIEADRASDASHGSAADPFR